MANPGPNPHRYRFSTTAGTRNRFTPRDRWALSKRLKDYKSQNAHLTWANIAVLCNLTPEKIESLVHGGSATEVTCETVEKFLEGSDER